MSYADDVIADLRLRILRELQSAEAYTLNEVTLRDRLNPVHMPSRDRLRTALAWLDEQGCLVAQQPGGVWLATLTARGEDAAAGRTHVPGVRRPRPGEFD